MKNILRSILLNVSCSVILIASCCVSSMGLPQTDAKPHAQETGTDSPNARRAYRVAMKRIHTPFADDFECEDAFLKAVRVMDDALLSDLNRRNQIAIAQINANLKNWRVDGARTIEEEDYELVAIEGKGQPYVLAAGYDIYSAVRVYAKNSEGIYELKAHLDNTTAPTLDYRLVGMRFAMISPKDGIFVTLFGTEPDFDCVVWQFDGEKINKIWSSMGRQIKFLRAVDGEIVFSKKGREVRYSWMNGGWVEHPPD